MTDHKIGTREEWLAARLELLKAEKELTRRSDELAEWRQKLPWVRIDKQYRFETDDGTASLADLFRGRSQLLVYHFMFGRVYRRLPSLFGYCGRLQRLRCAPREPRRRDDCDLARTYRRAAGLQAPHGLDVHVGVVARQRLQLRLQYIVYRGAAEFGPYRLQLPHDRSALRLSKNPRLDTSRVCGHDRHRHPHLHPRGAGHERVRTLRRRRLPHLLHLCARP
jgi:Bacterial protein of unknown function (DUF899)